MHMNHVPKKRSPNKVEMNSNKWSKMTIHSLLEKNFVFQPFGENKKRKQFGINSKGLSILERKQ